MPGSTVLASVTDHDLAVGIISSSSSYQFHIYFFFSQDICWYFSLPGSEIQSSVSEGQRFPTLFLRSLLLQFSINQVHESTERNPRDSLGPDISLPAMRVLQQPDSLFMIGINLPCQQRKFLLYLLIQWHKELTVGFPYGSVVKIPPAVQEMQV